MEKERIPIEEIEQGMECPIVDKHLIVGELITMAEESGDIAKYIRDKVQYGRALGYAEGKRAAYAEIAYRIVKGKFDPEACDECCDGCCEECCYGHEM